MSLFFFQQIIFAAVSKIAQAVSRVTTGFDTVVIGWVDFGREIVSSSLPAVHNRMSSSYPSEQSGAPSHRY